MTDSSILFMFPKAKPQKDENAPVYIDFHKCVYTAVLHKHTNYGII